MLAQDHPLYPKWHVALESLREALERLEDADEADRFFAYRDFKGAADKLDEIAKQIPSPV